MKVSDAYPSKYLKASDLNDTAVKAVIERIEMEDLGDDTKPVLYFKGKSKGLVTNKTNANNMAFAFGDEMNDWVGAEIELYPTVVDFQGRSVDAIRVRIPRKKTAIQKRLYKDEADEREASVEDRRGEPDDSIPF